MLSAQNLVTIGCKLHVLHVHVRLQPRSALSALLIRPESVQLAALPSLL